MPLLDFHLLYSIQCKAITQRDSIPISLEISALDLVYFHHIYRSTASRFSRMAESSDAGRCGKCCCSFIFTSGLTALFMWLSLRTSKPTCSVQQFFVPALNKTDNSTAARNNHTIFFDIKLDNGMKDKGVHYDPINFTFFYDQNYSFPIATYTVPGFYQGHGKHTSRKALVEANGVPWVAAFEAVSNGSPVSFRAGLATRVKFKILSFYTKKHNLIVKGEIPVDDSGKKKNKKGIKLKSNAPHQRSHRLRLEFGVVIFTFFLIFLL
ncbi:protein NDR1-like [Olea europaea var. sylvestris]|uniref:protein NDR1-like n=1 Tax=Olea europaea var. sylvestris TaxID=158386 RepID=UPI000C1D65D8|nr:protein NDR1-like [Olea europaea var. sylvestris]